MFLLQLALQPALAQDFTGGEVPEINAQNFRPTIDGKRTLWTDDTIRGLHKRFGLRGLLHYTDDPLVYIQKNGDEVRLVSAILQADVMASFSFDRLRLGVDLPIYLYQTGQKSVDSAGIGDISVDGKLTILDDKAVRDRGAPIGLALNGRINLPTGTTGNALGNPNTGWEIAAIVDKRIDRVLLAANLGVTGAVDTELENVHLNDFFTFRTAVGYEIKEDMSGLSLEVTGKTPLNPNDDGAAGTPVEWLLGGYGRSGDVLLRGGFGTGITPGIGSPDFRVMIGASFDPRKDVPPPEPVVPVDTDGDGIVDVDDQCPAEAEDKDKFEDEDGCPDPDNDGDKILDVDDKCPMDPEDVDGFEDEDGCIDETAPILVKLVDSETKEPIGVGRIKVTSPNTDKSGGSEKSLDLRDGDYAVHGEAGGYSPADANFTVTGAPQTVTVELTKNKEAKIVVTKDRIDLKDKVYFNTAKATILSKSHALLDEAVQIMTDYPEIRILRIEGHTDKRGSDSYNLQLSKDRAASVRQYFIDHGIAPERLKSEGFGETKPLDPADTKAAYEKNRRVDFFIESWVDSTEE